MKSMNLIIVRLLLFFYLTSTYLSATHIHKNSLEHNSDCKICIVVKKLNSGDAPAIEFNTIHTLNDYITPLFNQEPTTKIVLKGFNAQAPPHLS
jgi:hypothetical protein